MGMKPTMSVVSAVLLLQLFAIAAINFTFCNGSSYVGCPEREKQALLRFKQDLIDPFNRLASWTGTDGDCCKWIGVVCDNLTGHVVQLRLRNPISGDLRSSHEELILATEIDVEASWRSSLFGKINPSPLDLKHLIHLDLSGNDFQRTQIPQFLGSMGNLRYLNLSRAGFAGKIPPQLGNLSALQYLDLEPQYISQLYVENLWWLSGLSLLEHLNFNGVNLSKASADWFPVTNTLSSLKVLQLSYCSLHSLPPLHLANFSSLATLSLSWNEFDNPLIPSWVFGLSHLVFFYISGNQISQGSIPDGLQNCTSLSHLDLSYNYFNSSIPNWLYKFNRLEYLDLSNNNLQISISSSALPNMTSLRFLDLSFNELEPKIPRIFGRLCNLRSIYLINVGLSQEISEILDILSVCISYGLETLDLTSNLLSGHLTNQLGQFKNLYSLFLRNNSISGPVPLSLGHLSSLNFLDLSHNKLNGTLLQTHFVNLTRLREFYANNNLLMLKVNFDWVPPFQLTTLRLGSCYLGPQFPSWLHTQKSLLELDISNSGIVDTIPSGFWNFSFQLGVLNLSQNQIHGMIPDLREVPQLHTLDLSSNNLSGRLPLISYLSVLDLSNNAFSGSIFHFLCNGPKRLWVLKLGDNLLSGKLADCWINFPYLFLLDLDNNKFSGNLPESMGSLNWLWSLRLWRNRFSGVIPAALKNCTELKILNIGENEFIGNIPTWIERFSGMKILSLRSNKFYGRLPTELCHLNSLQILDLSDNNFFGSIPVCINKLSAMVKKEHSIASWIMGALGTIEGDFIEEALLVVKGKMVKYNTNLNLVRFIDLSGNNLSGEIPMEVTNLEALQSLNLSNNYFTGKIPENIGVMTSLEALDFSANQLFGEIPQSIASLTFLSHLNLSNNNLIGKIPLGTQLQSFDASSFTGNKLFGPPLPWNCTMTIPVHDHENGDGSEREVDWFYLIMALGFIVGFWGFLGPLLVNKRWRYVYCHFLDRLGDKLVSFVRKCC